MIKNLKVWILLSQASFRMFFVSKISTSLFLFGKIFRFCFFLVFLILLVGRTKILVSYSVWQVLLFYLTFNIIDATTQMLFRNVYRFRQMVITGSFDLILVKPVSPLLRILLGGTDLLDFITLIPFILAIIYITSKIPSVSVVGVVGYILLIFNSLIISAAFHIFVMALGILTTEVDNAIMIYRDLTSMGKVPVDIYKEPIKSVTTYILPIGIMMTFPVKVLIGMLDIKIVIFSIMLGLTILKLSHILWQYSLNRYTSASS